MPFNDRYFQIGSTLLIVSNEKTIASVTTPGQKPGEPKKSKLRLMNLLPLLTINSNKSAYFLCDDPSELATVRLSITKNQSLIICS